MAFKFVLAHASCVFDVAGFAEIGEIAEIGLHMRRTNEKIGLSLDG